MKLNGKVALVLGAIKGIGKGIGLALAKQGVTVALNYFDWDEELEDLKNDLQKAMNNQEAEVLRLLNRRPGMDGQAEVLEHTHKEQELGKFEPDLGETQWRIYLKADGSVFNNIPFSSFLATLRFPCEQSGKDATSYEYRPIDDCSASGLNLATSTCEKMHMHGPGTLLASAREVREVFSDWQQDGLPIFAKGDHEKAYRQWPVHEEDYNLVVALVWNDKVGAHGGFQVYAHSALPFGALSFVTIYTTISEAVCFI